MYTETTKGGIALKIQINLNLIATKYL